MNNIDLPLIQNKIYTTNRTEIPEDVNIKEFIGVLVKNIGDGEKFGIVYYYNFFFKIHIFFFIY